MEDGRHAIQVDFLTEPLVRHWQHRNDYVVGGNQFLYYSRAQIYKNDFVGPDFYLAVNMPGTLRTMRSWVVWEQGKPPDLAIEILSPSTAHWDKTGKKLIYQNEVRVPEYYWHDLYTDDLAGFVLRNGVYQPISPDERGMLRSEVTGLMLTRVEEEYGEETIRWLRWALPDGTLLPTGGEQADRERERAERERERAERFAARLRELGIDPDA